MIMGVCSDPKVLRLRGDKSVTDWLVSKRLQDENKIGLPGTEVHIPSIYAETFELNEETFESEFGFSLIPEKIEINADQETVWKILCDIDTYPDWNPFHKEISIFEPVKNGNIRYEMKVKVFGIVTREILYIDEERYIFIIGQSGLGFRCQWLTANDGSTVYHCIDYVDGSCFTKTIAKLSCISGMALKLFREENEALKQRAENLMVTDDTEAGIE